MMADIAPVMIWTANTSKDHTFFNRAWINFTGRSMDDAGFGWNRVAWIEQNFMGNR